MNIFAWEVRLPILNQMLGEKLHLTRLNWTTYSIICITATWTWHLTEKHDICHRLWCLPLLKIHARAAWIFLNVFIAKTQRKYFETLSSVSLLKMFCKNKYIYVYIYSITCWMVALKFNFSSSNKSYMCPLSKFIKQRRKWCLTVSAVHK